MEAFIYQVIYDIFLEYPELFKALQLTLPIIRIRNHSKIFCFFVGSAIFLAVTVLFSRLLASSLYFFIGNPPSHTDTGAHLKLLRRRIQKQLKHLRWNFFAEAVNWFYKKLHGSCLTGLRIRLFRGTICNRKSSWEIYHSQFCILSSLCIRKNL